MRKTQQSSVSVCVLVCLFAVCLFLAACSGGSKPINLVLNFNGTVQIDSGQSLNITVTGAGAKGVMWSLGSSGSITNQTTTSVTYNAPTGLTAPVTDHLTATSLDNSTKTVVLAITDNALPSISTTQAQLTSAPATVGNMYTFTFTATGGSPTLTWSATGLPSWLTISTAGVLSGTPPAGSAGTLNFTVTVTDASAAGTKSATSAQLTLTVNQASAFTSATSTTFTVGTAGTFMVTTTGSPTPSISETGALPTGVTFKDNGNGTGTLSGTPAAGTAKNYAITFTAHNGIGADATQSFTLTVGQPPAITSASSTTFTVGTAGTFTVTATGFPPPTFSETGALPTGVTLNATSGVLSGTPAAGTGGTYTITIKAHNGVGTDATQSFTLTVDETPAITSANKTTFTVGTAGTFTVTTSGFPTPSIAESGALPTGVTFVDNHNGTGTLAGIPATGTAGNYPITFTPSNGVGSPAAQSFTLTVGQAPAITSGSSATFTVGTAGTFNVTTSGFPPPSLMEAGTLPSGVTFKDNGNGTGTLSGTPATGTGKAYSITFTASNGVTPNATQTFTLTVDEAPSITSATSTTFTVGAAGTFTVTTTGFPAPALAESGTLPSGVTFKDNGNGTGTLSGTPGAAGTFSITFTATNSLGSSPQTFTLTVNTGPVITSANSTTFTVGASGSFTVTATGTPTPTLSETGALPTGVTFNAGTGVLSGTPATGKGGTYPITFTASNGVGSPAMQSFTLTVDEAPAITSLNATTFTVGASGSFTVMTTGFPKPALSDVSTPPLPSGVTFKDNGDGTGTLSGTPASGTAGTYSITFTANNGVGTPATQSFTLTVNSAPVFTTASSTTFTVGTNGTFTITATGTPTPSITESGALPSGVAFTGGTGSGTLSGTPAAGTGGTFSITFTATSSSGTSHQTFTLTVDEATAITSANSTTFTVGTHGSFTVTTTGFPQDPITETGALPSGVTFVDNGNNTATLSGTPAAGTANTYPITITASNGVGAPAVQAFTLTVSAASACTTGGSESLFNGGYAFVLTGFDGSGNPALVGGVISVDGAGHVTAGTMDMNLNSGAQTSINVISGTFSVGSDHRGCMSLTTNSATNATQTFRFSLGGISGGVASTGHMINFDAAGPFTTGILRKQSGGPFSNASVSGSFAFGASGIQNAAVAAVCAGKLGVVGVADFNGSGSITGGFEDVNQCGKLDGNSANTTWPASPVPISGGTYSVSANGHATLTLNIGGITFNDAAFVVSSSEALFMISDPQTAALINAGVALKQTGAGSFTNSSVSGTFAGYDSALGKGGAGTTDTELIVVNIANPNITGNVVGNDSGTLSSMALSGITYSVAASGRTLLSGAGVGTHAPLLLIVDSHHVFFLNSNGRVNSGFFESQTSTSASGNYAFGGIDPEASTISDDSGVVSFASGNVNLTQDKNSSGTLTVGATQSATFSTDAMGGIHIPSGCTTTCVVAGLVISPTRLAVIDLTTTNPKIDLADQ